MEEERHVSSYVHIYDEQEVSKYTVTFDTREKTGSYRIKTTTTVSEYETDKWDPNEVGQYSGDINSCLLLGFIITVTMKRNVHLLPMFANIHSYKNAIFPLILQPKKRL